MHKVKLGLMLLIGAVVWYFTGLGGHYVPVLAPDYVKADASTLVILRGADSSTLDPAYAVDLESTRVLINIFEGLVRYKEGSTEIEPCLATSWEVNNGGLEWIFHLREGVLFHDGTPFNAAAVKYSINRQLSNPHKREMLYAGFVFAPLEDIRVVDEYTIKFELKYPYAPFLNNLAMPMAAPIISPAAFEKHGLDFGQNPVGTGPYHLAQWVKDRHMVLEAFDGYWGEPATMPKLVFKVVSDEEDRQSQLLGGQGDIIDPVSPAAAAVLRQMGLPLQQTPALDVGYLGFFTDQTPFKDPRVRRAVAMAINREELVNDVLGPGCIPAAGALPAPVLGSGKVTTPDRDPAAARALLSETGYGDGLDIVLITYNETRPYNPTGGRQLANALREQLAAAGFKVTVQAYPWDEYKKAIRNKEGNAFLYGWISDNGDPDNFLYTLLSSNQIPSGLNASRYSNPELDTLLLSAQGIKDREIRGEVYLRAQQILVRDNPLLFLNHSLHLAATSREVEGYVIHPTGLTRLDRVAKNQLHEQ